MHRRHRRHKGRMTPEASLAEAEAARRAQERKAAAEQPVTARLEELAAADELSELFREALR